MGDHPRNPQHHPGHRPVSFAHLAPRSHSGWRPLGSDPYANNPRLSDFPLLDGDASVAFSLLTSPLIGPADRGQRRPVRRRNADRNLRGGAAVGASTPPIFNANNNNNNNNNNGGVGNLRSLSGAWWAQPPRNNVFNPGPPPAPGPGPAPAPTPAPAPVPDPAPAPPLHVQWQGQPPNRIASDVARAADNRALLRTKQGLTDRFLCYHTSIELLMSWDRDQRRPYWSQIPIPPQQGDWPGHPPVPPGQELDLVFWYRQSVDDDEDSRRDATSSVSGVLHQLRPRRPDGARRDNRGRERDRLTTRLVGRFQPAGLQFKRRLGQGGFGAVFLFEMVGDKGVTYPIVVKASTREARDGEDAFRDELRNLNLMNGAAHFIQRVFLQDLPFPAVSRRRILKVAARNGIAAVRRVLQRTGNALRPRLRANLLQPVGDRPPTPGPGRRRPRARADPAPELRLPDVPSVPGYTPQEVQDMRRQRFQLDNSRDIIVLENMSRGDLGDLINKLVKRRIHLSNRALWTIFECLFKGCVGMATPGRFHELGMDATAHAMVEQDETVPMRFHNQTRAPRRPMVHFDLDPQNALVGNFGDPDGAHANTPIIKVADPGLAVVMNDDKRNDEFFLWSSRCRGKGLYLLPEQFTREWEYRAAIDLANLAMGTTAGKYSWWSNLYQIGWIMWSLITHCFPPAPPRALPYAYASEVPGVVDDFHGFTYGMHVMAEDFVWCDVELRRQILRCLDHDPTNRPTLVWFEAVLLHNVRRPDLVAAESDAQLRAHMNDIYGEPDGSP